MLPDPSSVTRRSSRTVRSLPAFARGASQVVVSTGSTVTFIKSVSVASLSSHTCNVNV